MTQGKLGSKHECRVCGKKFYDLGKPKATCPQCGTDQKEPARERKSAAPPPRRRAGPAVKRRIPRSMDSDRTTAPEPLPDSVCVELRPAKNPGSDGVEDDAGDGFVADKADIDVADPDALEGEEEE
ncbi:MAG: hypothetical protein GY856_23350 [bacterium]|nr:hypothetical protein [bacterium]